MKIEFNQSNQDGIKHKCNSRREGGWIIFTCSHCPQYERKINLKTKEMKIIEGENPYIKHSGSFVPVGLEGNYYNAN